MSRGRKGEFGVNIELRDNYIRLRFSYRGKRYREPLPLKPTTPNIKHARRLAADVARSLENDSFDFGHFFPNSKHAQAAIGASTLKPLCDLWLKAQGRLGPATLSQYSNALKFWQKKLGTDTLLREIGHIKLAAEIGSHKWASPKLCNNYLIPLRGVFELAKKGKVIPDNPLDGIENMPIQRKVPDPLDVSEVESILAHMRKTYPEQVWNYFEVAFFTGMRPEEQIALTWPKIDFNKRLMVVDKAKTFGGTEVDVKTKVARTVELNDRAYKALLRQKKHTFLKPHGFVFENPGNGWEGGNQYGRFTVKGEKREPMPWHDERSQRDTFWKPTLRKLGIRMRRTYQTRSTCATMMLMAGMNPAYCAEQLGHSVQMFFQSYAKWINASDRGREQRKLEEFLKAQERIVPELCPKPGSGETK